mmetsp:Transcript_136874/g.425214  ORF Transcript_136874/g.425214 Transcript_136874/m.425214 type:complete len:384 (-) Transcript_136874:1200-2351(-)
MQRPNQSPPDRLRASAHALQGVVGPLLELAAHGHDVDGLPRHPLVDAGGRDQQRLQLEFVLAASAVHQPADLLLGLSELLLLRLREHVDAHAVAVLVRAVQRGDGEHPQGLLDVADVDVLAELHLRQALRDPHDCLELPDGDGDGLPVLLHRLADGDVVVLEHLGRLRGDAGGATPLAILDVLAQLQDRQRSLSLLRGLALVQAAHVLGEVVVAVRIAHVADEEHHVEARQDGRLEVHLVCGVCEVVVCAEARVGGGQHGTAGVQHRGDACLRNGDGLLLHGLVDGYPVLDVHLVKLVDTHDARICEHHGATLQGEPVLVRDNGGGQTGGAGALSAGVDGDGSGLLGELQELTLCRSRVAEQQDVDVAAHARAVRQLLPGPGE